MTKKEIQQEIKKLDIEAYKISNEMNTYWKDINKKNKELLTLKKKVQKMGLQQKIIVRFLIGVAGVFFATAIFVHPASLIVTASGLGFSFIYSEIVNGLTDKYEQKIKKLEQSCKTKKQEHTQLFAKLEEIKNKRYSLVSQLKESNADIEKLGEIKPLCKKYNVKGDNGYEK